MFVYDRCVPSSSPPFSLIDTPTLRQAKTNHMKVASCTAHHCSETFLTVPCMPVNTHVHFVVHASSSSSLLSDTESLSVSHPSASSSALLMPKDNKKPMKAIPPKTPKAKASPFGLTLVATVNKPPLRNGPAARPAADRVCARPFSVPRTW